MLIELFKMSTGNWGIYDIKTNKVADVPSSQLQLFQTLKFRLIVAIAFYSLLSVLGNLNFWVSIAGTALFYSFITFFYYQRALPSLKWTPYDQLALPQQQDVTSFFQPEKIFVRIGFSLLVSILAAVTCAIQPQSDAGLSIEQIILALLGITMLFEAMRQGFILTTLKKARG